MIKKLSCLALCLALLALTVVFLAVLSGYKPKTESFYDILSSAGITLGERYDFPSDAKVFVLTKASPYSGWAHYMMRNAVLEIDQQGRLRDLMISTPEEIPAEREPLSSISLRTSDGTDMLELTYNDIGRLFGMPSNISQGGVSSIDHEPVPPSCSYYFRDKNKDQIIVEFVFSGLEKGDKRVTLIQITWDDLATNHMIKYDRNDRIYRWPDIPLAKTK
jgi:hypothetical protein